MKPELLHQYYDGFTNVWNFMKEFLQRDDYKINEQEYWLEVVVRATEYMKGQSDFFKTIFCQAMDELQRLIKEEGE